MGMMGNAYGILFCKPEGKTPFGRSNCRRKADIKLNIKGIVFESIDWILPAESGWLL
jgi:hypothetical protein